MTRKEEIWQHALVDAKVNPDDFVAGAEWADKTMIDKACEWLKDNTDRYLYNTGGYEEYIPKCGGKMFEDFKKAMEE